MISYQYEQTLIENNLYNFEMYLDRIVVRDFLKEIFNLLNLMEMTSNDISTKYTIYRLSLKRRFP